VLPKKASKQLTVTVTSLDRDYHSRSWSAQLTGDSTTQTTAFAQEPSLADDRMGLTVEDNYKQEIEETEQPHEYTPYQPEKGYGWGEALPEKQGLYDPSLEKDACGVGFAA
jgi:hypothetical protein